MASHQAFVDYVTEQLRAAGKIRARSMFGEYGLYCNECFFAVICDDQLFVKRTPQGEAAFPQLPKAPPYPGAKASLLVEDVEDRDLLLQLTQITCSAPILSPPKSQGGNNPWLSTSKRRTKNSTFPRRPPI